MLEFKSAVVENEISRDQLAELLNEDLALLGLVASVVAGFLWDHLGHAAVFY